MGAEQIATALDRWPWLLGILAMAMVLAVASKTIDQTPLLRWIAALFRWIADRQVRREDATIAGMQSDIGYLKSRVEELAQQLADRDTEIQTRDQWIEYAYAYFWRMREWAIERGIDLPPPPLKSFSAWRRDRDADQ